MSKMLISKKAQLKMPAIIVGIAVAAFSVWFYASGLTKSSFGDSDFEKYAKIAAPILLLFVGLVIIVGAFSAAKSWISIYDDHIEGIGVPKGALGPQSFYYDSSMQYTFQMDKAGIKVSCNGVSHTVSLSAQDAQEVYRFANSRSGSQPQANPQPWQNPVTPPKSNPRPQSSGSKIVICPYCAVKARVPLGKGRIRVTCPNPGCGQRFEIDT